MKCNSIRLGRWSVLKLHVHSFFTTKVLYAPPLVEKVDKLIALLSIPTELTSDADGCSAGSRTARVYGFENHDETRSSGNPSN